MCFCFTSNENCLFSSEKKTATNFLGRRDTFRNKIMENVEDFDEKSYNNNGKPWNSSRDFACEANFLHFSVFIIFLHSSLSHFFIFRFFHFSIFLHFFICFSFLYFSNVFHFFHFSSFLFFPHFSFIFLHFSSSFSSAFLGCSKSDFFWPQLLQDFLYYFFSKNHFLTRVSTLFGPSFPFFLLFFLLFLSFFLYVFRMCFIAGISIRV